MIKENFSCGCDIVTVVKVCMQENINFLLFFNHKVYVKWTSEAFTIWGIYADFKKVCCFSNNYFGCHDLLIKSVGQVFSGEILQG